MIYNAINVAARPLAIDKRYILHYIHLNQDKPVLGKYTFKLLNNETTSMDFVKKVHLKELKLLM